jgi:hypothetical protein
MLLQSTIEYRQTVKLLEEAQKNAESLMENYKILEALFKMKEDRNTR